MSLGHRLGSETPTSSSGNESESSSSGASSSRGHLPALPPPGETGGTRGQLAADSSSESESESDGSDAPKSKWEEYQAPILPHRVLKLRRLLFEAFHAALTIVYETQAHAISSAGTGVGGRPKGKGKAETVKLDVKEPWMRLSRGMRALQTAVGNTKESDEVCARCTNTLRVVISRSILPLTEDKPHVRKLARNEAKAIPSFLKSWTKLSVPIASSAETEPVPPDRLAEAKEDGLVSAMENALIVILRLAHHSLLGSPRDGLDLSSLALRPADLDAVDISTLGGCLGIPAIGIVRLDLSMNGWKRLPSWVPFPYPKLRSLDLTNNTHLDHLPLSLLHLPLRQIHIRGTQLEHPSSPLIRSIPLSSPVRILGLPPTAGPPTLLHIVLRLFATQIRPHYPTAHTSLNPRLAELVGGMHTCELCAELQFPNTQIWRAEGSERSWAVKVSGSFRCGTAGAAKYWEPTQVVRVKGRACGLCEARYLRSTAEGWGWKDLSK